MQPPALHRLYDALVASLGELLDHRRLFCHNTERFALARAVLGFAYSHANAVLVLSRKHVLQEVCQGCVIACAHSSVHLSWILDMLGL